MALEDIQCLDEDISPIVGTFEVKKIVAARSFTNKERLKTNRRRGGSGEKKVSGIL